MPQSPGVYLIKDARGTPIYIGKARRLKERLLSHFREAATPLSRHASRRSGWRRREQAAPADFKGMRIRKEAESVDIVKTSSEAEALLLEASLVKEYRPKYNKELKDDKSYPFLKITVEEEFPRLLVVRGRESDGSVYYGPYTSAGLLRQAVSLLRRFFPMRTCQPMPDKVCLMYHIGQCHAPCEGKATRDEYLGIVNELRLFLDGRREVLIRNLEKRMLEASRLRRYEAAQLLRDEIRALSAVSGQAPEFDRELFLDKMRQAFQLARYPRRIEAFDVSNFQGKNPVGSLVLFENGRPRRSEYRLFHIKSVEGIDDYGMMREVVRRRYERLLNEKKPLPDLVLIDGGKGHLAAARAVLNELNLVDLDLLAIAKRHEYLFKPGRSRPFVLPQDSPILQLLRYVRDEAHRFAISFYRKLHRKAMRVSELDAIPGVGPKRKELLLKKFKAVSRIRRSTVEELRSLPGMNAKTARNIVEYLERTSGRGPIS